MFDLMQYMANHQHEQLAVCFDNATGLRAIIALHNTTLGPGLGGTRIWPYKTSEAAIRDVLRLSEAMTYKAAVAGLPLGGGKAVILADGKEKNPTLRAARFRTFGCFVESLKGRYIAAEDVGTNPTDIAQIKLTTSHAVGIPIEEGGSGDPSPMTAFGVMEGIKALTEEVLGTDNLMGIRVAIQGLGKVGMSLAEYLVKAGAIVIGTDIFPEVVKKVKTKLNIEVVQPEAIYDVRCDIFAPCALGGVINDRTISRLSCKIVAGCANNQLEDERHGGALQERGIIYAVDYVINAGGLINVAQELNGYDEVKARKKAAGIYHTVKRMLTIASREGITTQCALVEWPSRLSKAHEKYKIGERGKGQRLCKVSQRGSKGKPVCPSRKNLNMLWF